jgi:hypothetical protein
MSRVSTQPGVRWFGLLLGLASMAGAVALWAGSPQVTFAQEPQGEEPIEVVIVQGFVKSIDDHNLVLTAPDAPHDPPLVLHPETRYVDGEKDVAHDDVKEGQLVRAALIPGDGDDLLAIVVEIVPPDEERRRPAPAEPPGDPGTLGEGEPMPHFDGKKDAGSTKI